MSDDPLTQILATLHRVDTRLETMERGQGNLERGQGNLERGLAEVRANLMARMDRLQDTLNRVHEDITVNIGRADAVERKGDHTRDELRDLTKIVGTMQRQIHGLSGQVMQLQNDLDGRKAAGAR